MESFSRGLYILAVAMALTCHGSAAQTLVVGKVAALRGSATGQSSDSGATTPLEVDEALTEGETVATGPESRLKLALRDGSVLTLGADATLKLDHLSLGADTTTFTLTGGYLRAEVAPVRVDARFEIHTPSMVAAVRGTEWIESYAAGATQLFVSHGRVQASAASPDATDSVSLSAGDGVTFSDPAAAAAAAAGMPPGAPRGLSMGGMAVHTAVSRWKPAKIREFEEATRLR